MQFHTRVCLSGFWLGCAAAALPIFPYVFPAARVLFLGCFLRRGARLSSSRESPSSIEAIGTTARPKSLICSRQQAPDDNFQHFLEEGSIRFGATFGESAHQAGLTRVVKIFVLFFFFFFFRRYCSKAESAPKPPHISHTFAAGGSNRYEPADESYVIMLNTRAHWLTLFAAL